MKSIVLGLTLSFVAGAAALADEPPGRCHVGVYRLADGSLVDVAPSDMDLRWRRMDGVTGKLTPKNGGWTSTLGWTNRPDGVQVAFPDCEKISFQGQAGTKVPLEARETKFAVEGGVTLAGRLVLPKGAAAVPVSVLVHGSESYSGRERYFEQRAWPAQGVGVFVYDKRGTGASTGKYTQDFRLLARDAEAAAKEARRLAGPRLSRIGFDGGSQGGWIAPLAASSTKVDYVIVRFGLAENALAEDREEVMLGLREKGYGPDVLAKAREITDATGKVMASRFKEGWTELAAVKAKYEKEPWFKDIDGEFSGEVVKNPEAAVRVIGPQKDVGTSWDYEPMPTLEKLDTPLLWILAGSDREAPVAETRRRLSGLAKAGKAVTVLEYPDTDHGIVQFEADETGKRTPTRYADGYYRAILEFAKTGTLRGTYGSAIRVTPPAP